VKKIAAPVIQHPAGAINLLPAQLVDSAQPAWASLLQPLAMGLVGVASAGATLALAVLVLRMMRLNGLAIRAAPATPDIESFVNARAHAIGVTTPPVKVSGEISTAVLTGFYQPTILLPFSLVEAMAVEELHLICAHELAHLRRRDHIRAPAERVLAALLWFNPFLLAALARTSAAREAVCDSVALEGSAPAERRLYAQTLVKALRLSSADAIQPAFIRLKGTGHAMRLKAILHPPAKPGVLVILAAATLTVVAGAFTFAVSGAVAHQIDNATSKIELAEIKPANPQNADRNREVLRPDVVFQVIFSKAGERLSTPTVVGQFGQEVRAEIAKTMRVEALVEKPDQNGESFTSAKMAIFQNGAWQPAKVISMTAKLSGTPSFEYSVDGTPYRFVVMPRLIVPAANYSSATAVNHKEQPGSIDISADKVEHRGGKTVRVGNNVQLEGGTIVYTGAPKIEVNGGVPPNVRMLLNGLPAPAGFDPKLIPTSQILRAEVTFSPPADGQSPKITTMNLITKPE
jgi:beta-lactamase regulating signal transducer with metallopeptidase domain